MKKAYITFSSYLLFILSLALFVNCHYLLAAITSILTVCLLALIIYVNSSRFHFKVSDLFFLFLEATIFAGARSSLANIGSGMIIVSVCSIIYSVLFYAALRTIRKDSKNYFFKLFTTIWTISMILLSVTIFLFEVVGQFHSSTISGYVSLLIINYAPILYNLLVAKLFATKKQIQFA